MQDDVMMSQEIGLLQVSTTNGKDFTRTGLQVEEGMEHYRQLAVDPMAMSSCSITTSIMHQDNRFGGKWQ